MSGCPKFFNFFCTLNWLSLLLFYSIDIYLAQFTSTRCFSTCCFFLVFHRWKPHCHIVCIGGVLLRLFIWFVVCLECVCVCLFVYISACLRVCVAFRLELRQVKTYCKPGGLHQCTLVPAWPVKTHKPDNYLLPHCSPDGFIQYALHHGSIPIHVFPLATSLRAIGTIVTLALLGPLI